MNEMPKRASELKALLDQAGQPDKPMRPNQVKSLTDELNRLSSVANAPPYVHADRGAAMKRYRELEKTISAQIPKKMEPLMIDTIHAKAKEVLEHDIRPAMMPLNVMRRNPAGAVDRNLKGEASRGMKETILTWKRAMLALNHDTDERDIANLEKYRPEGTIPGQAASFMVDAQIPGHFAMSPLARANWPEGMPPQGTANSALNQVKNAESERRRNWSAVERAEFGKRMAEARKAKKTAATT